MGHNIEHRSYPISVSKSMITSELNEYVRAETYKEGGSGLYSPIRWNENHIYNDYDEACEAISRMDKDNYDQIAVKYYSYKIPNVRVPQTKKLKDLAERLRKAQNEEGFLYSAFHFKDCKSKFIGCPKCGSKLNRAYLYSNNCPVCHADMRPKTTLDKLKSLQVKVEKLTAEYNAEKEKYLTKEKAKAEKSVNWLVKIEYHT